MKKILTLLPALISFTLVSAQHSSHPHKHPHPETVHPKNWSKPTVLPDHIILTYSADPATTQSVTWRTDTSVKSAYAQIALADAAPGFWKNDMMLPAVTRTMDARDIKMAEVISNHHSVTFTNLLPDTTYAYRVGDSTHWSEWFQFRTAAGKAKPFSFLYVGDAQNYVLELWSRLVRGAFKKAPDAKFIIHAGDLINHAHNENQWHEWFLAGGWLHGMLPSIPTPGNHEYRFYNDEDQKNNIFRLSVQWDHQFTLPQNGPDGIKGTAYYVDYNDARIISLNSNRLRKEQAVWLDKVLSETKAKWKVLTFHHPIFSGAGDRDNKELRELWKPIIDKHKVDLVLTGHDHTYTRGSGTQTGPSTKNNVTGVNAFNGNTVYVVSVSGGKMYTLPKEMWKNYEPNAKLGRVGENTQLFQVIHVNGNKISYESFTATGQLYDAFDLIKNDKTHNNRFVEKVKLAIPERRHSNTLK